MSKDTSSTEAAAEEEAPSARVGPAVLLKEAPSENPLFHDLYPARRGKSISFSTWQVMMGFAKNNAYVQRCEDNVIMNLEKMPMVQTMIGALESMGCAVELDRHISCEVCTVGAYMGTNRGGYDDSNNQLFICANNCTETGDVHGVLVRNLMHMFDRCVAKVDFKNADHLACMEVRKANLASCNFMNYLSRVDANLAVKKEHRECVKKVALENLIQAKFVDREVAKDAVDRVFSKCYGDLEPIGRRLVNQKDFVRMRDERYLFGYN